MLRFIVALIVTIVAGSAVGQTSTGLVDITALRTGWNSDAIGVVTAQPIINPANCPTADGYVSTNARPGYQTFLATSLTAFALSTPVVITVYDTQCDGGRPVLIGINLSR